MRTSFAIAAFLTLLLGAAPSAAVAEGTLTVTYTTQSHGGPYAPTHVVAVWIETEAGAFVKTIDRWAGVRRQHLVAWTQKAGAADADAVSGATLNSHAQPLTRTWDLRDRQGQEIPDGTYTIRMELADSNANQALQNAQGTFTFTKTAAGSIQTGLSNGGFTNVTIEHTVGATPPIPPPAGPDAGVDEVDEARADMITGGCATGGADLPAVWLALAALALVRVRRRHPTRRASAAASRRSIAASTSSAS